MKFPLVSVVIPCFNSEKYIQQAIESVLNQDYKNIEIIVVDDLSDDSSVSLLKNFGRRISLVVNSRRSGACRARNTGLECSKGKYIKFLDSDDFLDTNVISRQVQLSETLNEKTIVYGNFSIFKTNSKKLVNTKIEIKNQVHQLLFKDILTSTPLHRRYMLEKVGGFDPRFDSGQEWNLHIRLASHGFTFIHDELNVYYYRVHDDAHRISNKRKKITEDKIRNEINKISMTANSINFNSQADLMALIAMKYWWLGRKALRSGLNDMAGICFNFSKSTTSDYKRFWPFYYTILTFILGLHFTEIILRPFYNQFGNKYVN